MFSSTYILLDAACMGNHLQTALSLGTHADSLYRGASQQTLASIAPYLFTYIPNTGFSSWYFENGWGNAWGMLFSTKASFEECHKHFRKFLLVQTEDGKELYFRFYDPRVLKVFLPSCSWQQVVEFFGPIDNFIIESENKKLALMFSHTDGVLKQEELPLAEICNQKITIQ